MALALQEQLHVPPLGSSAGAGSAAQGGRGWQRGGGGSGSASGSVDAAARCGCGGAGGEPPQLPVVGVDVEWRPDGMNGGSAPASILQVRWREAAWFVALVPYLGRMVPSIRSDSQPLFKQAGMHSRGSASSRIVPAGRCTAATARAALVEQTACTCHPLPLPSSHCYSVPTTGTAAPSPHLFPHPHPFPPTLPPPCSCPPPPTSSWWIS